jgi:hypothetical protein
MGIGGGDGSACLSPATTALLTQLQRDYSLRQRELAFSEAGLEKANAQAREADLQHQQEVADLRKQVCDLSGRVSSAYRRGSEKGSCVQQELDEARRELGAMCSELAEAQAETEFAEALHGISRREYKQVHELRSRSRFAGQTIRELFEERALLEGVLPKLREELRESEEACKLEHYDVQKLDALLQQQEQTVTSYEVRARELRRDLRSVVSELRASFEGAQKEKTRLEVHITGLERARSPRAAAVWRMKHYAPLLQDTLPSKKEPGVAGHEKWWQGSDAWQKQWQRHSANVVEQPDLPTRPVFQQQLPPRLVVREAARAAKELEEEKRVRTIRHRIGAMPEASHGNTHHVASPVVDIQPSSVTPERNDGEDLDQSRLSLHSERSDSYSPERKIYQIPDDAESVTSSYWKD